MGPRTWRGDLLLVGLAIALPVVILRTWTTLRERDATIQRLTTTVDSLKVETGKLDTVLVRQIDTLRIVRDRWTTLRDTLRLLTPFTVRESVLVQVADSVIDACTTALTTCQQRDALRLGVIVRQDSLIRALQRPTAKWLGLLPKPHIGAGVCGVWETRLRIGPCLALTIPLH